MIAEHDLIGKMIADPILWRVELNLCSCVEFGARSRNRHLRKDTRLQKLYNKYLAKEFVNQNAIEYKKITRVQISSF